MSPLESVARPTLRVLSASQREQLHEGALQILETVGMKLQHPQALELLAREGVTAEEDGFVKIPRALVEQAVSSAPRSIQVFDRNGEPAMDLGGDRSYFGTGSDLPFRIDDRTGERRRSVLDDVRRAARLCDALEHIDFVMSMAQASDVPVHAAYVEQLVAMVESTRKPLVCTADKRADLSAMRDIAALVRGGEGPLREKPYLVHYAEPVSPLLHPFDSLDKLLFAAEAGMPVIYSPAPIAGSTAPMTIAGHVAQGVAECLAGLVVHQLRVRGAPFLFGMGPAVLDMATIECSYNAPEYYLAAVCLVELARHLDLPSWGYAGTSDSQLPDEQAHAEATVQTFLAAMAGANLCHDVGYLDFGQTGSLEMIAFVDEQIGQLRRMLRGVPTDAESLALDVVADAGKRNKYLAHKHTRRHVRQTQWRPRLTCRLGFEKWHSQGGTTMLERSRARVRELLASHVPEPLAEELARQIRARADRFAAGEGAP